ncbi:MAG: DegT/DnrJ/EryC1/StrS family aminotransferase [Thermoplasmata archaeon]|nr:MAG: DegT/DnrJ/EryC1/StrS family aminotransferase [Thermoplasmata archaeon]
MDKIPLCTMYIDDEIKKAVLDVIDSGWYVKGENGKKLEAEFAKFCHAKHGVSVNSGTAALFLALKALGIGPGDEVIIPSFSFVATASPIMLLGAIPVFADIDLKTYTMDPNEVRKLITSKTKVIMPVHLYGHPAEMQPIMDMAKENNLKVVEDACQAHGAEAFGHKVGTIGDIACFSYFPSKNMTVAGEGGMITTNDAELAKKMQMMKDHGRTDKHTTTMFGFNFRLSEIHAAIGRVQLKHLPDWVEARRKNAAHYTELLKDVDGIELPQEMGWAKHAYHLYVINAPKRDELAGYLKEKGIATGIHYYIPIHKQPYILDNYPSVELTNTEYAVERVLSLPFDPRISLDEIKRVTEEVKNFTSR